MSPLSTYMNPGTCPERCKSHLESLLAKSTLGPLILDTQGHLGGQIVEAGEEEEARNIDL